MAWFTRAENCSLLSFFFAPSKAYANSRDLRTWPKPVVKSFIKALPNKRRSAQKGATKQGKPWGTGRTICDVLMVNIRSIRRARECVRKINVFRGERERRAIRFVSRKCVDFRVLDRWTEINWNMMKVETEFKQFNVFCCNPYQSNGLFYQRYFKKAFLMLNFWKVVQVS